MSIILKGIDLPKKDQVIVIHGDGTFNEVDPFARRLMPFYEAIQIPKGHGDIKDVSEFIKAVDHAHDNVWNRDDWLDENMRGMLRDTKKRIEKLPTILEAEEE